jgi:hypothetical protein
MLIIESDHKAPIRLFLVIVSFSSFSHSRHCRSSILKSIEFAEKEEDTKNKTLEMLLLEKNKALQTENTHLKVAKTELAGRWRFVSGGQGHIFAIGIDLVSRRKFPLKNRGFIEFFGVRNFHFLRHYRNFYRKFPFQCQGIFHGGSVQFSVVVFHYGIFHRNWNFPLN